MKNQPKDLLVCYDIRDPKRLIHVFRCMRRWGLHIQYSVFYCQLTQKRRHALESELRTLIDERVDDIRIYGIRSSSSIEFLGRKPFSEDIMILGSTPLAQITENEPG